jgi:hypothetical protein
MYTEVKKYLLGELLLKISKIPLVLEEDEEAGLTSGDK